MKVLLVIFNYKEGFPFVKDLEDYLKQEGVEVDLLDSCHLYLKKHDGCIQQLTRSRFLQKLVALPKIGTAVRVWKLRMALKKYQGKYDAVNVHNCDTIYAYIAKELQRVSVNLYPMIWGSDFYRANTNMREKKRIIFDRARYIVFGNPVNALDFTSYYKGYKEKAIITGFGVAKFEIIEKIREKESIESLRYRFGFPSEKIIVAVGYNGSKGQQHDKLLEELTALPLEAKEKIFLVLQMTYGASKDYTDYIQRKVFETQISYQIITNFLNDEETSRLRLAVDVVLNAQTTDGFSSSIQEHIYAGNIVVLGEWLPYKPFELANIFYFKKSLGSFALTLQEIIERFSEIKAATRGNSEKIYNISSWASRIHNWISIYKGEGAKFLYNENDMCIR